MNQEPRDPFAELEDRRIAEWKSLLVNEPELLAKERGTASATGASQHIRTWDQIPDVTTIPASKIEWIVDGIIPQASVTLIAGEPGSYKSWLALMLLRAVSTSSRFLDRKCKQTDILYLDRENPIAVIHDRLAILGVESLGNSRIWGGWLQDAPPAIGDERLVEMVRERKPIIIFDSLIRFHDADENSATEMAPVMRNLRALANAGATVVALHHKAKTQGSNYRGSSDIVGGVDTAFTISRDRQAGLLKLECFKSRFVEEFSLTLRPDLAGTGDFVVTESPEFASRTVESERIAQYISANPGQNQSQILAALDIPHGKGRAMLAEFEGRLWRTEPGAHNAKLFSPVPPAKVVFEV
jgi:predicted ATP-dependent serine protease